MKTVAAAVAEPLRSSVALRAGVVLAYAALLAGLAVAPSVPDGGIEVSDKLAHAVAYAGQAALLLWAIGDLRPRPSAALVAWLGATSVGAATELLQLLAPPRRAELGDLVADAAGAAALLAAVLLVHGVTAARRWRAAGGNQP